MNEQTPTLLASPDDIVNFFQLTRDVIDTRLRRHATPVNGLRKFPATSQVNFLFEGTLHGREVIVKANYFRRSILHALQRFLVTGPLGFQAELECFESAGSDSGLLAEADALERLAAAGIPVPDVLARIPPSMIVLRKVPGEPIEDQPHSERITDRLANLLARIHDLPVGDETVANISIIGDDLHVADPNFNAPAIYPNVSSRVQDLVGEFQCDIMRVLHGDFKGNNVLLGPDGPVVLDPKMHRGHIYYDVGKYLVRAVIHATAVGNLHEAKVGLSLFLDRYAQAARCDRQVLEKRSLLFGLLETGRLVIAPPRPNAAILGRELTEIHAVKDGLLVALECALYSDNPPDITSLFNA